LNSHNIRFFMKINQLLFAVFLSSINILPQTFILSGRITDAQSGEALPYSNVRVINTTLGTAANMNGDYQIKLSSGTYSIVASYIGYYSDTVNVELTKNMQAMDFSLKRTEILLPEIVFFPEKILRLKLSAKL